DRRFVGRYFSSRSEILGINTGLMIALKVSDALSIGLSYQPINALTVDFGAQYTLPATRKLRQGLIELTADAANLEAQVKTSIYSMVLGMRWRF
ncbi:MAG: hypothetical protein GY807_04795, partial [Gammaproteobacteria bacterium]|nr:hypothetical protein [Gammaproteobacteria bacterium]